MEKEILLVDDEEIVLKTLELVFRSRGYTPHTALDGLRALEILQEHRIQVIFVDLRMPVMDGMTLCRKIKESFPDTCVFALSAFVSAFTPEEFAEAGFEGFFSKPFRVEAIARACDNAFIKMGLNASELT